MQARLGDLPGDPLFIQVAGFNNWMEKIVGTPFIDWIKLAKVVYIINHKGACRCVKDIENNVRLSSGPGNANLGIRPAHINELFDCIEEMLTHDQAPIRKWGLFYLGRGRLFNNSRRRRRERRGHVGIYSYGYAKLKR